MRRTTLLVGFAMLFAQLGCSTGARLRGQAKELQSLNAEIHDRAYRCAPKELAFAEANVDFGLYELTQGNFVKAKKHLLLSERNAKKADRMSDFDECRDQAVAIVVDTTKKVEIKKVEPKPGDKDGDGITDDKDQCPLDPEDFEGFEDSDGCPDLDNDKDGIEDLADNCMFVPEDVDGFQDSDGCPDYDNDGDGLADINDQCKDKPEDYDGYQDEDGCDDPDNDGRDAVFGLDGPLHHLVNAMKSAAAGYGIERRVLLLHGPVGSSKSTIARMLKTDVTPTLPASLLRTHPSAHLFLDHLSSGTLDWNSIETDSLD